MPLHIAAYLADTRRLTTLEHGAYLLLLMEYWLRGPLPDDDRELATIAGVDRKLWTKEVGPSIRRYFRIGDDARLHQKRSDAELAKAHDISSKRRAAAQQRGGRPASSGEQNGSKRGAIAEQMQEQTSSKPPANEDQTTPHARVAPPLPLPRKEDSELRSAPQNGAGRDIRKALYDDGLPVIRSLIGKSDQQARTFLGLLLKKSHDDCARVYAALREAETLRPAEPSAWLIRAATPEAERDRPTLIARDPTTGAELPGWNTF